MKFLIPFTLLLLISIGVSAQETLKRFSPRNSVYAELGGRVLSYSLNYERIIPLKNRHHLTVGAGGFWNFKSTYESVVVGAASVGYLYGYRHSFEFGANYGLTFEDNSSDLFSLRVGYRYQHKKGFLLRAGILPLMVTLSEYEGKIMGTVVTIPLVWPYISLGYSF